MKNWEQPTENYYTLCSSLGYAPGTLLHIRTSLRYLLEFCAQQGLQQPCDVTGGHIAQLRQTLSWQPGMNGRMLSESAIAGTMSRIRSFFRWAVEHNVVLLDPTRHLVVRRVTAPAHTPLTLEEMQALLATPDTGTPNGLRDRAILETLYGTGVRTGECFALDIDDIDLQNHTLTVRCGKNGDGRVVPIGDNLSTVLDVYLRHSRPRMNHGKTERALFLTREGKRYPKFMVFRLVQKTALQAGLKRKASPHDLRHALGTHLLVAGADIRMVQAMLGHNSILSTERYTHLTPADTAREFRDKHPRAKRPPRKPQD